MLDVYSDDEEYALVRMNGVMKSFYHQILLTSKVNSDINTNDPVWHIAYRKPNSKLTVYKDKVLDTIKRSCTYDKFGLTYNDLMNMDIVTFDRIREIILETDRALQNSNQAIANNIADLNKK